MECPLKAVWVDVGRAVSSFDRDDFKAGDGGCGNCEGKFLSPLRGWLVRFAAAHELFGDREGDVSVFGRHEIVHAILVLVFAVSAALGEPALQLFTPGRAQLGEK